MPYPHEHSCRLVEPNGRETKRKNSEREHEGKRYDVIYQEKDDGSGSWEEQAYRYPIETWTESQARSHCRSHHGIRFEPATEQKADSSAQESCCGESADADVVAIVAALED